MALPIVPCGARNEPSLVLVMWDTIRSQSVASAAFAQYELMA